MLERDLEGEGAMGLSMGDQQCRIGGNILMNSQNDGHQIEGSSSSEEYGFGEYIEGII